MGGIADYAVVVHSAGELQRAAELAIELKLPYLVIGAATNCLISDVGFPGVVIINQANAVNFVGSNSQVVAESGVKNAELINAAAARGLGGAEFLSVIPGTIGGAVVSGASHGGKAARSIVKVGVFFVPDSNGPTVVRLPLSTSDPTKPLFGAGQSIVRPPILLSVTLQLARLYQEEIMRRLRVVRGQQAPGELGYVFRQDLSAHRSVVQKLGRPLGIQCNPANPNIWQLNKRQSTGQHLKTALTIFREQFQTATGVNLDFRLDYLGYWPDEDS